MKVLNILATGGIGGIETLCNNIDKLNKIDNYWYFFKKGGEIATQIQKRNPDKTFILNYGKFSIIKVIKEISMICKKEKIDIVTIHHGGTYCNMIYYYLKKINPNIKFIRFLHACYEEKYILERNFISRKLYLYYINKALQNSDLIISVSNAVQKSFEEKFDINKKKKVVIYNGIDEKFLNTPIKEKSHLENETYKIIYVGRLEKVKGVDILIKAIDYLLKDKYNVKLTIVGGGTERKNLEELSKKLKVDHIVNFIGKKENVIKWLDEADIFVYSSVWEEAFGISVVEAMARECIPITFYKGGLPEIIRNGENGFFSYNVTEYDLANTIKKCISCKTKEQIKKSAKETAQKYTIKNTVERLEKEYNSIM